MNLDRELVTERLDWMIETMGPDSVGSLPTDDGIVFAFRSANDDTAHEMADYLAVDNEYTLFTGIGIHRRVVQVA